MTYLNSPRLHFAGRFRADVSTVNNTSANFRDSNDPVVELWNPSGSGRWTVTGCTITGGVAQDGTVAQAAAQDPAIGLALNQIDTAVLVDLDTEQQLVSQIWGMRLALGGPGNAMFRGAFKAIAFTDLWGGRASVGVPGDAGMTAAYHSVLTGVTWGDTTGSRLLTDLRETTGAGLLSIKFNVDGFNFNAHAGRIVGTIGPASADEPAHFVRGRHCKGNDDGPVWFFPAVIDTRRGKLVADFGNALQTTFVGGPIDSSVHLEVGTGSGTAFKSLGRVPVGESGWYEQTAGLCEFPADRVLTAEELTRLGSHPITVRQGSGDHAPVVASEGADGKHVRADSFVYRLSANTPENVALYATQFGEPLPNTRIDVRMDISELQRQIGDGPQVGTPADGLNFPDHVSTDAAGTAVLPLTAASIGRPRDFIDGQVYGVRCAVAGSTDPEHGGYLNSADYVSALVWTDYHAPDEPAWIQDVEPILGQYARLYPVMKAYVDLASYDSVVGNIDILDEVFNRSQDDPHYMPVTRDLSPAKRQMILAWLQTTGNAGQPNFDRGAAGPGAFPAAAPEPAGDVAALGSKTAALANRLSQQP